MAVYLGLRSMPMARRPSFWATTATVPAPEKGSRTVQGTGSPTWAQERRQPLHRLHIPKQTAVVALQICLPYLLLKRPQAELILEIERIRAAYTPDRHKHPGHSEPMPQEAVAAMDELHHQLLSLKSNKRPIHLRTLI